MSKEEKELKNTVSRRKFLGMSGLAVGAAGVTLLTGCGGDSNVDIYAGGGGGTGGGGSPLPETWDGEADFVFVGYGGAAALAAIHVAKESPSSKIIILELNNNDDGGGGGGSTRRCGGGTHLGGGTTTQTGAGFTETADQLKAYAMAATGEGADEAIVTAWAQHAKATYDALVEAGVEYDGFSPAYGTGPATGFSLVYDNERRPELEAKAGRAPLHATVGGLSNVEVIYGARASGLILNEDGRVVGVAANDDTKNYKAGKAVLICAGGFINNPEMVQQFIPHAALQASYAGPYDFGDGIKMVQAIGADLRGMGNAEDYFPVFMANGNFVKACTVNLTGERFAPEDLGGAFMGRILFREYTGTPIEPNDIPVADKPIMKAWNIFGAALAADLPANVISQSQTGATLAELAGKIGVDPGILEDTINRYNGYVTLGTDLQYRKDPDTLLTIAAPFYAFPLRKTGGFTISCGGLRINDKSQVLDTKKEVIKGLYAAGAAASTIVVKYYMAGSGTAGAFVFGRIAGIEMTKEDTWA